MSGNRKYVNLPDLDQAPEVYQTLEDIDNATTVQAEESVSSRHSSSEESDEESSRIERSRLDPDSARSHFTSSRVDASRANFSDEVGRHRRSYYVTTTRREEDEGDLDPEQRLKRHNLSRRIGRMQQLLEDLKNDIEIAKDKGEWKESSQEEEDGQDEAALVKISESISRLTMTDRGTDSATARMKKRATMKRDSTFPRLRSNESSLQASRSPDQSQDYSQISDPQALAIYTQFSTRLNTLENLLGLDSIPPPDLSSVNDFPMPIISMTDVMARQMNLLNDVGEPFLDQLAKKIQDITISAERMEEKREEARKGYEELVAARESSLAGFSSSNGYPVSPRSPTLSGTTRMPGEVEARSSQLDTQHPLINPELPAKISALHSTLPAIESLAPMLYPTLERLRALREVHQDSASAHTRLNDLEQHEVEIQKQLKQWREALGGLETQTNELEEEWLENMMNVEKKVKNLEGRIHAL